MEPGWTIVIALSTERPIADTRRNVASAVRGAGGTLAPPAAADEGALLAFAPDRDAAEAIVDRVSRVAGVSHVYCKPPEALP
jgi:hypothetical protein